MRILITFLLAFTYFTCSSQALTYSCANAHSHNDYEQKRPFYQAWSKGFGSIEADIFLHEDVLVVAHDSSQLHHRWTLDSLYLEPLKKAIDENGGSVYTNNTRELQLMIDIKSDAVPTIQKLIKQLEKYNALKTATTLKIVISGNRPAVSEFANYPSWIFFDGEFDKNYSQAALEKVPMLSDDFAIYSSWKGVGDMPDAEKKVIQQMINKAHGLQKKIRFWNAPDNPSSWKLFVEMKVDYINTDKIDELSQYLTR